MITTQKELRAEFWRNHPQFRKTVTMYVKFNKYTGESMKAVRDTTQNEYPTDIRVAWCDFVDDMYQSDQISKGLAERATL